MKRSVQGVLILLVSFVLLNCPSTPEPVEEIPEIQPEAAVQEPQPEVTEPETEVEEPAAEAPETETTEAAEPETEVEEPVVEEPETETTEATEPETEVEEPVVEEPETETTEPVVEAPKEEEPKEETPKVQPVTQAEVNAAKNAVARAEEVGAEQHDPTNLRSARNDLSQALRIQDTKPDEARKYLESSKKSADTAYANTVERAYRDLEKQMNDLAGKLRGVEADRFARRRYEEAVADMKAAEDLQKSGDFLGARKRAQESIDKMSRLYDQVSEQIARVKALKKETEQNLEEAAKLDAHVWAADKLAQTNDLYLVGIDAFQEYDLDKSEISFGAAREAGRDTVRLAADNRKNEEGKKSEELMLAVMKEIEEASVLTVVTEDGFVIDPAPWPGQSVLREVQATGVPKEDLPIGTEFERNLLDQAKAYWKVGVDERTAANYRRSLEYFLEARRYAAAYRTYAVRDVYTVRLIPERRDCLWRIAEYDFIYGNPFLWPKIWIRNRYEMNIEDYSSENVPRHA